MKKINDSKLLYIFQKMVLIGLLYHKFVENMLNFPKHTIYVYKQDASTISKIDFQHYFSRVNLIGSPTKLTDLSKKLYNYNKKKDLTHI